VESRERLIDAFSMGLYGPHRPAAGDDENPLTCVSSCDLA
jgi:hypothetical protein